MPGLSGKVAVVTGASRREGKGVALGLGEAGATVYGTGRTNYLDLSNAESPQFIGRVVAALASDPAIMDKSGQILVAAALARECGCTDIDGRQPRPITLEGV